MPCNVAASTESSSGVQPQLTALFDKIEKVSPADKTARIRQLRDNAARITGSTHCFCR
jgi:hypothetical protein